MANEERNAGNAVFGLNEPQGRRAASPESPGAQGPPPSGATATSSGSKVLLALGLLLLALAGVNLYLVLALRQQSTEIAAKQADQLNVLTRRLDSSDEKYAQLKGQFQVTSEKLGLTQQELSRARTLAANIEKQQQDSVRKLNQAIAQKASADEMNKLQADANAKFGTVDGNIADINKKIGETNDALTGAKGELTGAIARTHDELVELAHKTDRDYFEFNLGRRGAKQKVGTVTVELAKTNTKKNLYTVNLYFDDKRTVRKDQAIDSPVYFYVQGAPSALEMVVNKVGKETVSGYLSAPKGFFATTPNVLSARPGA